jgi:two-component system chemotaxis sensor kinase CheA
VVVRTHGAEETIDRRVSEALVEACMTLARNAVAHGIEPPNVREALGKNPVGTITLSARKSAGRLVLTIADDGRGVDVDAMRARAVELDAVTEAVAGAADDNTLLALLFLPGFSTREKTDLLAGRGIGLDIAHASVQRMGGAIRLSSKKGLGFEARVEVPIESGIARVLWVSAGGVEHAIAAQNTRRVLKAAPDARVPHLAACLEPRAFEPARLTLELALDDEQEPPLAVGIDGVGRTEEVLLRPLTPLVSRLGPFAGAVVRGDGALRLALDVHALAPRVRALAVS